MPITSVEPVKSPGATARWTFKEVPSLSVNNPFGPLLHATLALEKPPDSEEFPERGDGRPTLSYKPGLLCNALDSQDSLLLRPMGLAADSDVSFVVAEEVRHPLRPVSGLDFDY